MFITDKSTLDENLYPHIIQYRKKEKFIYWYVIQENSAKSCHSPQWFTNPHSRCSLLINLFIIPWWIINIAVFQLDTMSNIMLFNTMYWFHTHANVPGIRVTQEDEQESVWLQLSVLHTDYVLKRMNLWVVVLLSDAWWWKQVHINVVHASEHTILTHSRTQPAHANTRTQQQTMSICIRIRTRLIRVYFWYERPYPFKWNSIVPCQLEFHCMDPLAHLPDNFLLFLCGWHCTLQHLCSVLLHSASIQQTLSNISIFFCSFFFLPSTCTLPIATPYLLLFLSVLLLVHSVAVVIRTSPEERE